ncbi:hypothetical protein A3860_25965 [Niastella vici]|uniref:ATPase AAA-type core domain-containing protein n=1 Tax=Niastella vici TaxID=1703345 RepID=A0A1V9FWN4_9BACT|nr:AAA family ATPase [Niastella vici]OQP62765.1 hypothetical protein A3860_25965 [Niastella vici]
MDSFVTYVSRIYLENYNCFKGKNDFSLLDKENNLVQWTVILGNNNTGKTSILKALADLEPSPLELTRKRRDNNEKKCVPLNLFRRHKMGLEIFDKDEDKIFVGCDIIYKKKAPSKSYLKGDFTLYEEPRKSKNAHQPNWGFVPRSMWTGGDFDILSNMQIYGYGVTRRSSQKGLSENEENLNAQTIFYPEKSLINIEDWLLQLDYASKNDQKNATISLKKIKSLIRSGLFPEISDFKFNSTDTLKNHILFKVNEGWFKLHELGYGYQTTISWLIDFCKKMFERYPHSANPLAEPAIVLIDEIDLHLHPSWQKNIVKFLSDMFPSTQFIVTTHSPLIIQSIEKINLFVLVRKENSIEIHKSKKTTFKGWSVEEILEDVMDLDEGTYSETHTSLIKLFDQALDENDYKKALYAYIKLDEILHPNSSDRKILKLQLSQLKDNDKA